MHTLGIHFQAKHDSLYDYIVRVSTIYLLVLSNRTIFTHCKKYMREDEIVHKRYFLSEDLYIFGPLLASKSRERYKKGLHPENMEKLTISNPGKIKSEVSFFFREDADGTTYILDPPAMILEPRESQVVLDTKQREHFMKNELIYSSFFRL